MESSPGSSSSSTEMEDPERTHVLVVADHEITRMHNALIFRKYCKVTTVESGLKALEFLGLAYDKPSSGNEIHFPKVNLVCTDYSMPPGINGYELLKKIKESTTMKNLPVVIMSEEIDPTLPNECLEAGALMFITKPLMSWHLEFIMMRLIM